jgi:hypothetical protein
LGVTPSAWNLGRAVEAGALGNALWGVNANQVNVTQNTYYNTGFKYASSAEASYYSQINGKHIWYTAPSGTAGNAISFTQAMTLDSSGNLIVGETAGYAGAHTFADVGGTYVLAVRGTAAGQSIAIRPVASSGTAIRFLNNAATEVGKITYTASATTYATSSDYRLKENIQPMVNALATVAQLKPVTYIWKVDGSNGQGFIAHELQAVVPDCVVGEKDAVDAEGKPVYQGIDTSFLVATLTAAIQELKAEFDAYKATHP